jgi:osmotically inducible protein OsmC
MKLKIRRVATAEWHGLLDAGGGRIALGSGAFAGPYSLRSRVGDEPNTNPEELLGAAHAGCFAMSLANRVAKAGHVPEQVSASARVTLEEVEGSFTVTRIDLTATGRVPALPPDEFVRLAEEAKATCPISRALAGVEITLDARLETAMTDAEAHR